MLVYHTVGNGCVWKFWLTLDPLMLFDVFGFSFYGGIGLHSETLMVPISFIKYHLSMDHPVFQHHYQTGFVYFNHLPYPSPYRSNMRMPCSMGIFIDIVPQKYLNAYLEMATNSGRNYIVKVNPKASELLNEFIEPKQLQNFLWVAYFVTFSIFFMHYGFNMAARP